MLTTDLALRFDPAYETDLAALPREPEQFADAFARAWFKLTHRDMGPSRALPRPGGSCRRSHLAGPIPAVNHALIDAKDIAALKATILASGLSISQLVTTAWASACDLPRQRQTRWCQRRAHSPRAAEGLGSQPAGRTGEGPADAGDDPEGLQQRAVRRQEGVAGRSHRARRRAPPSRPAAKKAGHEVTVPFAPGRTDASQEQTDVESFAVLEPAADGFRNYLGKGLEGSAAERAGGQGAVD